MSLKGVCNIEVRNEDGSLAQKTTDDNMITNFISNLINPDYDFFKGLFDKNVMKFDYALYPLIDKVIGGVFLFGDTLPEDPDYRVPKAPLIGHASSTYQYNLPTVGLFNKNESTVLSDTEGNIKGFKYVWDFATDKANGTIKCVSLTTGKAGSKGYKYSNDSKIGNTLFTMPSIDTTGGSYYYFYPLNYFETSTGEFLFSSDSKTEPGSSIWYNSNSYDVIYLNDANSSILIANLEMDVYIFIEKITNNCITFARCRLKKDIGLYEKRNNIYKRVSVIEEKTVEFDKTIFKTIGSENPRKIASKIYTDDKFIYISGNDDGDMYIYKLDPKTLTVIETQIFSTEIKGVGYHYSASDNYQKYQGCVKYNGYLYTTRMWDSKDGSDNPWRHDLIKIDITDTNKFYTIMTLGIYRSGTYSTHYLYFSIYDGLLFFNYQSNDKSYYCDQNGILNYFDGPIPIDFINLKFPYVIGKSSNTSNNYISYGVYNQGLITIDNLSTPIIKNSTQTMKITYEITEE